MAAGGWEGRWTGGPQRILRAVEPLPVTLHWWTHDTMLVKPHGLYNAKNGPYCKLRTLVNSSMSILLCRL